MLGTADFIKEAEELIARQVPAPGKAVIACSGEVGSDWTSREPPSFASVERNFSFGSTASSIGWAIERLLKFMS